MTVADGHPNLFRSFFQAGFECSTHKLKTGKRLDIVASTQHDVFIKEDYARLKDVGIKTVREGVRWCTILNDEGRLDFSSVRNFLDTSKQYDIEIIWDLFHFGWPDQLSIFGNTWIEAFEALASGFAAELERSGETTALVIPVNEISFFAWAGGDVAYLNPFERGRGAELKTQMVRGWLAAARAMRQILPGIRLLSAEPVIHILGDPLKSSDEKAAEGYRQSMFEAWDMLLGLREPELGGNVRAMDIVGVNFYDRNEWWNFGPVVHRNENAYRPFHQILVEVYNRYKKPMFVAETGTEDEERAPWLAYILQEARRAMSLGVPVAGICLYPILNHPGWDDDRHCFNGLWDYALSSGDRTIYEPLAAEIRKNDDL